MRIVLGGAKDGCQALPQFPTQLQGQHTDKHVATGASVLAAKNRPHLKKPRFPDSPGFSGKILGY
jgi:hypothetical protein